MKQRKSLEEILQSVSGVMFPDELGGHRIEINTADASGDTPLHVLIWCGDSYGAKLVVEAGADVNAVGDMGETPLQVALSKENREITEALLQAGANPDIRSEFDETAREKAEKMGGVFKKLLRQYCDTQPSR